MPLQKSLSEQNRYPRRQQWQRSKSNSATVQPPRAQGLPLVTISKTTKNKLQKFQFQPPPAEDEDEAAAAAEGKPEQDGGATVTEAAVKPEGELETSKENNGLKLEPTKTSPRIPTGLFNVTTPMGRLAWYDLMRPNEGPKEEEEEEDSPKERLLWHNEHDKLSSAISPMLTRRRKKRARSSSPSSSPSNSKPSTPAVNVEKLKEALRTPHADPALELWDRFTLNSAASNAVPGAPNPSLSRLIAASPKPAKDAAESQGDNSSLRRAISCGTHWPKRRRIDKYGGGSPTSLLQRSESDVAESKTSMVTALLETVTGEINKCNFAQARREAPKSPSPRKRPVNYGRAAGSPNSASRPTSAGSTTEVSGDDAGLIERRPAAAPRRALSDYGDDDFDDDTLMELDVTLLSAAQSSKGEPSPAIDPSPPQAAEAGTTFDTDETLVDEFGDLDDDVFAAAEDLIAELDSKATSPQNYEDKPSSNLGSQMTDPGGGMGGEGDVEDFFGDDFGGDFDFEAAEMAATQSLVPRSTPASASASASASLTNPSQKPRAIQRYLVTNVLLASYADDKGREYPEKILVVQAERTKTIKTVHLRGDWLETPVSAKSSYVHIIGDFEQTGMCVIDNNRNILILHPDQLISSTVVADSFSCTRRAVLQDRVKATNDASPALVYGTLLHEIFQEALMANNWDSAFLGEAIDRILKKHIEELYTIKVGMNDAREHLAPKMTDLRYWAETFVSSQPKPDAVVQGRNGEKISMCVSKLLDVEEHVWSPMYGLKGNIDATVQVTMKEGKDTRTLTVPFELKTGKNATANHQAQTVLYNLLLSDRYDLDVVYGILYYMESSQMLRIPAIRHELRHMIMQRNQLACYVRERSVQLPPMKKSKGVCSKCYAQTSCFIYHKLADDGDGETSGMKDKFDDVVKHLTPAHREFFLKWEDLLTKEEKESQKLRRELWTMVSVEREKLGRCFADVVIEEGSASEEKGTSKINRFHYTFIKENPPAGFSFMDSQITVGEPIVISDEVGHFALALGYVTAVRKRSINVAVDRRLHNARIRQPGFDENTNQVFAGIMEIVPEGVKPENSQGTIREAPIRFRLDKDEFSNGMAVVRNNLVQVMADGPFGSRQIRRLVVDLVPPTFKTMSTQYVIADKGSLNVDQKSAIEKVMSARDYALVLGMPGTGKTTTIAHIIRALISQKKSVLLTSYTHTAVDNILLKLKEDSIPILRLGAPAKVHPDVQEFAILAGRPKDSFEEIRAAWHDTPVVATTCLGISHAIFNERTFDYCIVDEASQITLPICLGPIRMARTFVLVGDHNQLPPLVQNEQARLGGLDVSLFKLLSDTHPESVVNLEHQYRMCEDIMTLSNQLIYQGRLKCGTEALRLRSLHVPNMAALQRHHHDAESFALSAAPTQRSFCAGSPCWLRDLLRPETRVAFVNTDAVEGSREEAKGNRIVNPCEARLVAQIVGALLAVGVPASEIGVMTHYRSQLALLRHHLRGIERSSSYSAGSGAGAVEMHTADRFQGRDKEVVVLSLVRSNEACNIGDLLRDWRRVNVAFTRAKTKLLVIGSRDTLRGGGSSGGAKDGNGKGAGVGGGSGEDEMIARFVRLMEERSWIYDLPADALESHLFDNLTANQAAVPSAGGGAADGEARGLSKKSKTTKPPAKGVVKATGVYGKENRAALAAGPKRARIGERALLSGRPILRDIWNDVMDGLS